LNAYGYHESHYQNKEFTLSGVAYDLRYFGRIGRSFTVQFINNYGSPNIPGPQMGLFNAQLHTTYSVDAMRYFSARYSYATRKYYNIGYGGERLPDNNLKDHYVTVKFHLKTNPNHMWEAGPSFEVYHSIRPSQTEGLFTDFNTRKIRFEYSSVIARNLTINMKAGLSDVKVSESSEISERRYDFHLLGAYNILGGYGMSFSYDYGPMVNSGLYQYPNDALNHSLTVGPSMMSYFFNQRVNFNLYANLQYRFDLNHTSLNINPRVEAYIFRDWYFVVSGTYHYSRQEYPRYTAKNSYAYAEFSIRKRWGKTEFNKWQKDTRRLKVIFFKDDNNNGIKDYGEDGVPDVKTRLRLTNSATMNVSTQFPIDIILLSNEEGIVIFNRLPVGFYDMSIYPLGDVKEYFYVDRGAEKLELTKTTVYYVPFQKASKLTGSFSVKRSKFIKQGEEILDYSNIRVTAYNTLGNSYSSFTLEDGTFTIFLPGNREYYVRMPNVFGEKFQILNNDQVIYVSDTSESHVHFNITEKGRQIAFKKAKKADADSVDKPLKIKVLHGDMYENPAFDSVDVNAPPEFIIKFAPPAEEVMKTGRFYVVIGNPVDKEEGLKMYRILSENGITTVLGLDERSGHYFVFTKHFATKSAARSEEDRLKKAGLSNARTIEYRP
jgi:hypothetical protein